jgi:hypothetical protein
MLEDLLKDLGDRIGVGPLSLSDEGVCTLGFAEGAQINITADDADPNYCVLVGNCGGIPDQQGRAAYLRRLLEANFFHRDAGNAVIALEPDLDEALLVERVRLDLIDGAGFADVVTRFVSYQRRWSERSEKAMAAG